MIFFLCLFWADTWTHSNILKKTRMKKNLVSLLSGHMDTWTHSHSLECTSYKTIEMIFFLCLFWADTWTHSHILKKTRMKKNWCLFWVDTWTHGHIAQSGNSSDETWNYIIQNNWDFFLCLFWADTWTHGHILKKTEMKKNWCLFWADTWTHNYNLDTAQMKLHHMKQLRRFFSVSLLSGHMDTWPHSEKE